MLTCALLCPPFFSPFPYHVVTPLFYACVCNPLSIGSQPFFFTWHVGLQCSRQCVRARIGWVWAREVTRPAQEAAPHNLSTVLSTRIFMVKLKMVLKNICSGRSPPYIIRVRAVPYLGFHRICSPETVVSSGVQNRVHVGFLSMFNRDVVFG